MNPFVKDILDVTLKPFGTSIVTELTNEEAVNVATIEKTVGTGVGALEATVGLFVAKAKSSNPIIEGLESLAGMELPALEGDLSTELGTLATADVPTLYKAGLAKLSALVAAL